MEARDREKLLERIRKLYAMSRESVSSPHEAEIAMRRCQSLMLRFGISASDLETSAFGASKAGKAFRAVPAYASVLGSAVAMLHDCLCVKSDRIEFRGFSIDAEVAALTYGYLTQVMERSLKQRKNDGSVSPGRSASFDYRVGFALAVLERSRRLDQERRAAEERLQEGDRDAAGTSLIVRKLEIVRQSCTEGLTTGRPQRVRYRNGEAHCAGSDDGSRVSLDRQLNATDRKFVTHSG